MLQSKKWKESGGTQIYLLFIFAFIGLIFASFFSTIFSNNDGNISSRIYAMRWMQLISSFFFFFFPVLILVFVFKINRFSNFFKGTIALYDIAAAIGLAFISIPFLDILNSWNASITFTAWWPALQSYFEKSSEMMNATVKLMMSDTNMLSFFINIFILAFVPAVFEEFFFRGILQRAIIKISRSSHSAIIITALIFSAFHMQWDGFFVRFVLGLFLGYIYYFSGNLIVPILLHFANNSRVVVMLFLNPSNIEELSRSQPESFSISYYMLAIISLLICIAIFYCYSKKHSERDLSSKNFNTN